MAKKIVAKEYRLSVSKDAHTALHAVALKRRKTVKQVVDELLASKKK